MHFENNMSYVILNHSRRNGKWKMNNYVYYLNINNNILLCQITEMYIIHISF